MKRLACLLLYLLLTVGLSLWVWVESADSPSERTARARGCYLCHGGSLQQQLAPALREWQPGTPISPALRAHLVKAHPTLCRGAEEELAAHLLAEQLQHLAESRRQHLGETLYRAKCAACHGSNGQGQPNAYPPLQGSEWLTAEPSRLPEILTRGLQGPISVRGELWNTTMLPPGLSSDAEVQAVIRYIRSNFAKSKQ